MLASCLLTLVLRYHVSCDILLSIKIDGIAVIFFISNIMIFIVELSSN